MPRSTSQLRALWGPPCRIRTVTISLYGAGKVTVDQRIAPAVYALNHCLASHGYKTIYVQTGAYVCRRRRLPSGGFASDYSLHAYGTALDINWQQNGFGRHASHNIPAALVADIEAIRTNNGAQVWEWGGHFPTPDYMHFQVCASPAELATGIRAGSIPTTIEEFTVDAEAKKQFDAVNLRLDAIGNRLDVMEKDRLKPTTSRVRVILEHLGLKDPA